MPKLCNESRLSRNLQPAPYHRAVSSVAATDE